jgi:hypothetical protein
MFHSRFCGSDRDSATVTRRIPLETTQFAPVCTRFPLLATVPGTHPFAYSGRVLVRSATIIDWDRL